MTTGQIKLFQTETTLFDTEKGAKEYLADRLRGMYTAEHNPYLSHRMYYSETRLHWVTEIDFVDEVHDA